MRAYIQKSLSVFSVFFTFALATVGEARPLDPLTPEELSARIKELRNTPWSGKVEETVISDLSGCARYQTKIVVVDTVTESKLTFSVTVVRPKEVKKSPVVVVVPSIEGTTPLEPTIAKKFCAVGIASIIADVVDTTIPSVMPSWGTEDLRNRMAILAIRTLLDIAENHENFDKDRIGLFGVSLGGIVSGMVAGLDPDRIKAVAIAVGGGNLPTILAVSTNRRVTAFRRQRMEAAKMRDLNQYEEKLRETVRYDPFYFAPRVLKERLLMVMAEKDTTVPFAQQTELFKAYNEPSSIVYKGGHIPTILSLVFWNFEPVTDFFKARFSGQAVAEKHVVIEHTPEEERFLEEHAESLLERD